MEINELIKLYSQKSKHSNYQILPKRLSGIINNNEIEVRTRYEAERLEYILKNVDVDNKVILDIGGNTGYFTFELLDTGAKKVYYYDGNYAHSEFVRLAAKVLHLENRIDIKSDYFSFEDKSNKYDIILLLNVLHHIGDDYGDKELSIEKARESIINQLINLSKITELLIFQLGFNWKGNRELCLFENGTKQEMIDYIKEGTKNHWEMLKIGVAESDNGVISYSDLNDRNIKRFDALGEFLNRPIFIMKSKEYMPPK